MSWMLPERQLMGSYELQLGELARGKGLGKTLMDELERIGAARGMAKSMLTCLKGEFDLEHDHRQLC